MADTAPLEFGLFFQLPQADGQDVPSRYRDTIAQIVEADRLGFDLAWLAEMHFVREFSVLPSPLVVAAAAAAQTRRIRLGTGVALIPLVQPIRGGGGRGDAGHHLRRAARIRHRPRPRSPSTSTASAWPIGERAARFDEAIEVILQAWSDEPVNFHGRFFDYDNVNVVPKPVQRPRPPIRLAANSDESFERAIAEGWPVFASPITAFHEDLDRRYAQYWEGRTEREGKRPPAKEVGLALPVHVAETSEQARDEARASVASYMNVIASTGLRTLVSRGGDPNNLPPLMQRNRPSNLERLLDEVCVIGSVKEVTEKLAALRERYGVGHFLTWCNTGGMIPHDQVVRSMTLIMERVAPALRS